jgi:two-component system NtrC family response regulator
MPERKRVLVVDDDATIRTQLGWALADEYDVRSAGTLADALAALREFGPDAVTLDLSLTRRPGESEEGLEVLAAAQEAARPPKVVMLTGSEQREHAVRSIELGAFDYCEKPVDLEELLVVLRRAVRLRDLEEARTGGPDRGWSAGPDGMVGAGAPMAGAFVLIRTAGATDAPALIVGEPGTGKKRAARAIHDLSSRAGAPFATVDVGAAGDALERGLFGAAQNGAPPEGLLGEARGGTLYLESVHALSASVQARLAAFLARSGGGAGHAPGSALQAARGEWPGARLLAGSLHPLDRDVRAGRFRGDLFYRLSVVTVSLPPLRHRPEDVVALAEATLSSAAQTERRGAVGFTRAAERAMLAHDWPGNITELEARVRRAVIMARGRLVSPGDLGLSDETGAGERTLDEARKGVERDVVVGALRQAAGNVSRAARAIGVSRPTLYDLIRKHRIEVAEFKGRLRSP